MGKEGGREGEGGKKGEGGREGGREGERESNIIIFRVYSKNPKVVSFVGNHVTLRRSDGAIIMSRYSIIVLEYDVWIFLFGVQCITISLCPSSAHANRTMEQCC